MIFLGTPHSGAALAKWAEAFLKSLGLIKQTNKNILQVLTTNSEILARIQSDFHTMVRNMSLHGRVMQITCFYEEFPLPGVGVVGSPFLNFRTRKVKIY